MGSAAFTSVFFINFCAMVFRCGCRSLWAGADAMCNIHSPGTHHCPWCAHNPAFGYLSMTVSQAVISFWPSESRWWKRLAVSLAAFPVFGGIAAVIYGTASGYW